MQFGEVARFASNAAACARTSENMILGFEVNQALDSTHKCEKATFECLGAFSGVIAPPSSKANACTTNLTLLTLKKKTSPRVRICLFLLRHK